MRTRLEFIFRRILRALVLLVGLSALSFTLLGFAPGDFLSEMRMNPQLSAETVTALRHQYGLDEPAASRYAKWLSSAVRGDLGFSFAYNRPVAPLLLERVGNTLLLNVSALALTWLIALPVGVWTARHRNGWRDHTLTAGMAALHTVPDIFFALVFLMVAARTGWLPSGGMMSLDATGASSSVKALDVVKHMTIPVLALVLANLPTVMRHVRSAVAEGLTQPFIRTAKAAGIPGHRIIWRHVMPISANPLFSLFGINLAGLLSSSLLVEVIMSWPGLGPLLIESVSSRDVYVIIGSVMASALLLLAGTTLADVMLAIVDPRVRMEQ